MPLRNYTLTRKFYLVPFSSYLTLNNIVTFKWVRNHSIENDTIQKLGYGLLVAFHSNYGRIFSRFDTIHERDGCQIETSHDSIGRAHACISRGKIVYVQLVKFRRNATTEINTYLTIYDVCWLYCH